MIKVMYPLSEQADYTELKYSLRSIDKYFPGKEVIIVGHNLPEWITGVTQIHVKDIPGRKQLNIRIKILAALEYSKEIFFLSDDVYLLKEAEQKYYFDRLLSNIGEGGAKPLSDQLKALNKPTNCWDVHCPIIYERNKFRALEVFTGECIIKSMYSNFHEICGEYMPDFKVNRKMSVEDIKLAISDRPYFSTGPSGLIYCLPVLNELFPLKSKYEL